ncbi:hypothetical protein [Acinetobacter sp.]|uniref:hypothetical protein n=1 Tax=Acinetobacter sp. TaxID=472 RepID=UPI0031E032E3
MQVTLLTTDEVADLIELHENAGRLVVIQDSANEVIYNLEDGDASEKVLINTACGSYLIEA